MTICYAVVVDGAVENTIVADEDFVVDGAVLVPFNNRETAVSPGYLYSDGIFLKPDGWDNKDDE